jgi:hypothetical protein
MTKLTLHQAVFETVTERDLHQGGWESALECLAVYLAGLKRAVQHVLKEVERWSTRSFRMTNGSPPASSS